MAHYLATSVYDRLVDALANLEPDMLTGHVTRDQVMIVLGEIGEGWPAHILPDVLKVEQQPEACSGFVAL